MAIAKIDDLKQTIRDALRGADFQAAAAGLTGASLTAEVARLLKRSNIGVTLISVAPAEKAALADFAAVWSGPATNRQETSWFSLKRMKR